MNEIWAVCPGFPWYSISTFGRVRRDKRASGAVAGKLLKGSGGSRGDYIRVILYHETRGKVNCLVHILVATAFLGEKPTPRHEVAHWDGVRTNCRVENLRWATRAENHADKRRHGTARVQSGRANVNAKLSEAQVAAMRAKRQSTGATYKSLGDEFGVDGSQARKICSGRAWKPIGVEIPPPTPPRKTLV